MKHYINIIYALLALVLFSCSSANEEQDTVVTPPASDEPAVTPPTPASTKWTFSYTLSNKDSERTRAADSTIQFRELDERNRVGLFCVKKSDNSLFADFDNLKYKPCDNGMLEPDGISTPNKPKDECKIIAYAPYSTAFDGFPNSNITFSVQKDQTSAENLIASDLLWGEADADAMTDNVDIDFRRALTRWVLTISIGDGLQPKDFQGATFAIYRIKTQVDFNIQTGKPDGDATGKNGIIQFLDIAEDNVASKFIGTIMIPPQTCNPCYLQIIFKDGVERYFKFDPFVFKQGKHYYSYIHLASFANNIQANIKSWEENNIIGSITSEKE